MITISSSAIPCFDDIAGLYAAAHLGRTPVSADFDLLTLDAAAPRACGTAPGPHRRGFFQLTYREHAQNEDDDVMTAAAPEQVLPRADYLRPGFAGQRVHTLLFKSSVVAHQLAAPANEFPFFCLPASLELPVSRQARRRLLPQLQALAAAARDDSPYRAKRLSALLTALLYDVRWIHEQAESAATVHRLCTQLACRFDEIVLQHLRTHRTVEDYARLLHVSADHLSAEIKEKTGRNARDIIAERLITEARHLLTYSELNVSEIAAHLGFDEPTHFTRFFKRHTQVGPQEFRRRILEVATAQSASASHERSRAAG
ncbi:MAG TPA: AraC family transcriptional regulator [Opitutaceae bacterium]